MVIRNLSHFFFLFRLFPLLMLNTAVQRIHVESAASRRQHLTFFTRSKKLQWNTLSSDELPKAFSTI